MKPVFEAAVDPQANVVRTRFSGNVTAAHMVGIVAEIEEALAQVRAGFAIMTDLSGLDSMELECAPLFSRIMDLCRAKGVAKVVRVIPDPSKDIGLNILSITHYRSWVQILTCRTLDEGERGLQ